MENKCGFIQDPFEDYNNQEGMRSGQLVSLSRSAHEYEYFQNNERASTKSMNLGRMIHYYLLEPNKFTDIYTVAPDPEKYPRALRTVEEIKQKCKAFGLKTTGKKEELKQRLKEKDSTIQFWDDVVSAHKEGDKELITDAGLRLLKGVAKSVEKHTMIKKILSDGIPEVSGYWHDSEYDIPCMMRADWLTERGYIVDLKTTHSGDLRSWRKKLVDYRYDIQAAWYCRGYKEIKGTDPKGFIHFVVETLEPYNIYCYIADNTVIECGETGGNDTIGYKQAIDLYLECKKKGFWPMPQQELEAESMPGYYL